MQKDTIAECAGAQDYDEELHDVLIAISVIAKHLARKISGNQGKSQEEKENGTDTVQELRSGRPDHQG